MKNHERNAEANVCTITIAWKHFMGQTFFFILYTLLVWTKQNVERLDKDLTRVKYFYLAARCPLEWGAEEKYLRKFMNHKEYGWLSNCCTYLLFTGV